MESFQPPPRAAGLDKGHPGDAHLMRPRASSERDLARTSLSSQRPNENQSPANFSRACEGMLKTTTETGDIGIFSIKPSRVPQSLGTPRRIGTSYNPETGHQKSSQNFQPYGVPGIDDRRRLPSYARDAASEVISMYESASQKSGSRVFDEPDYRSYSMTQTSYSSYTLSNHRSYNSLRSQADANAQVQRPRSPFAYPARLKRPGFRPSSPALTDGGLVDYSRRAEIERKHPGAGHNTSSPSSLYAHRRRPHQLLRPDGNRSTPSLLSQSSPPRRSSSPLVSRSTGISSHDWARRPGPASVNTSPARSTFSLASTVNLYTSAQPPSTSTTPGKVPPSPRYYDYTEDFEVQAYSEPAVVGPPPSFRIDKTIPEDRPMSAERPLTKEHSLENGYDAFQFSSIGRSIPLKFRGDKESSQDDMETKAEPIAIQSSPTDTLAESPDQEGLPPDRGSVRLSGLGYGAQQLRSHVEEAFGNFPSSALEITNPNELNEPPAMVSQSKHEVNDSHEKERDMPSARSSYSVITSIPHFPSPPNDIDIPQSKHTVNVLSDTKPTSPTLKSSGSEELVENPNVFGHPTLTKQHRDINTSPIDILKSLSEVQRNIRASGSDHRGLAIAGLDHIDSCVPLKKKGSAQDVHHPDQSSVRKPPMISPTIPDVFNLRKTDPELNHPSPTSLFNRRKAVDGRTVPQIQQPLKRGQYHGSRRLDFSGTSDLQATNVPNFSHQIPKKEMARSESPMLAPKPISPARQLKLKNSVPQLMKALPPLPPEPLSRSESPLSPPEAEEVELPFAFSPIDRDSSSVSRPVKPEVPAKVISPTLPASTKTDEKGNIKMTTTISTSTATEKVLTSASESNPPLHPPRMKLKVKSSISQRPTSPPESRPWNLAENYPWSSPAPSVRLPSVVPDLPAPISKPPRFKLKITRASNSTQGTVRVNRESADSKPLAGLHLRNPKDLFTPSTGLDNIFRNVSRHLHSRRTSMASSFASQIDAAIPPSLPSYATSTAHHQMTSSSLTKLSSLPANPLSNSEARSVFSDDSSRGNGDRSLHLRGRISNLKAKIAAPYANRVGAQSYDDITWRDRQGAEAPIPVAIRPIPDLHADRKSAESLRPMRRWVEKARRQKLKAKVQVQGWLKEAKSAIVTRVRTHSITEEGGS